MISRLNTQLPSTSPTAISGVSLIVTALTPVASSGREVTTAISTSPTQLPPIPVRRPITSP